MRIPSDKSSAAGDFVGAMTPLIDIVFLLLIYFLCTASFAATELFLPTTLPPTGATSLKPPVEVQELELIRIGLISDAAGVRIELNGQPMPNVAELGSRLRQLIALAPLPAVLDVAPDVELGDVVTVYDVCRMAGITAIHFAAPG